MFEKWRNSKNRTIFFATLSSFSSAIFGIFKIVLAILSRSILIFIYAFYNIGIAIAKRISINRGKRNEYHNYFLVGILIILSSFAYVIYSTYRIYFPVTKVYPKYQTVLYVVVTITDIVLAVVGIVDSRKKKNLRNESIKFINLATSLILVSFTQSMILSMTEINNVMLYSAVFGIVVGLIASMVGTYMINHVRKIKNQLQ